MSSIEVSPAAPLVEYTRPNRDFVKKKDYQHAISQISEEFGSFQERVYADDLEFAYQILDRHPEISELEIISTPSTFSFRLTESGFLRRSHDLTIERTIGSRTVRFVR